MIAAVVISLMATFGIAAVGCAWTLYAYSRVNSSAWLKMIMLAWYVVASALSVASIGLVAKYPETRRHWTLFYNCAGQLIALTGVVDVWQFNYCRHRLLRLSETNIRFLKIYAGLFVAAFLTYCLFLAWELSSGANLTAYRVITCGIILSEAALYALALLVLLRNKRAAVYYGLSFASRAGILASILCRIGGVFDTNTTSVVHTIFVMFAVVPVGVFSLRRVGQSLNNGLNDVSGFSGGVSRIKVTASKMSAHSKVVTPVPIIPEPTWKTVAPTVRMTTGRFTASTGHNTVRSDGPSTHFVSEFGDSSRNMGERASRRGSNTHEWVHEPIAAHNERHGGVHSDAFNETSHESTPSLRRTRSMPHKRVHSPSGGAGAGAGAGEAGCVSAAALHVHLGNNLSLGQSPGLPQPTPLARISDEVVISQPHLEVAEMAGPQQIASHAELVSQAV